MLYIVTIIWSLFVASQAKQLLPISLMQRESVKESMQTLQENCLSFNILKMPQYQQKHLNISELPLQEEKKQDIVMKLLRYSAKFRKLNFSLQQAQLSELANDITQLCKQDLNALFFIAAYFLRSCQILQKQRLTPAETSKLMKRKIKEFMYMTSIESYRLLKYGMTNQTNVAQEYFKQIQQYVSPIVFRRFFINQQTDKNEQIQNIIMQMVEQGHKIYDKFHHLVKYSSHINGGLSFHINFKIQHKQQARNMKRIKQKLLRQHFKAHCNKCLNQFFSIADRRIKQQTRFQRLLNSVYNQVNYIDFQVKDILRAKCTFHSPQQIRNTLHTLIEQIEKLKAAGEDVKIVQFENRLNKTTCDVILIIQFGDMPLQVQYALDYDEARFQISHRMYELLRSKMFSPIVLLFDWFEKVGPQFLSKIGHYLINNTNKKINNSMNSSQMNINFNSTKQLKQYKLLNQFFNLTSYLDLKTTTEEELQKQMIDEILRTKQSIIEPFVNMGPGLQ